LLETSYVSIRNFADGHKKGCKATSFVVQLGEVAFAKVVEVEREEKGWRRK
jgi:hypothetical protein